MLRITTVGLSGSIALAAVAAIAGCRSDAEPAAEAGGSWPGFAVFMTGYEVPEPEEVPFEEEEQRQEYLRFYHQGYVTTMWASNAPFTAYGASFPMSEHPSAATQGHYDGQEDAHHDKAEYWRDRGVGPDSGPWFLQAPPARE